MGRLLKGQPRLSAKEAETRRNDIEFLLGCLDAEDSAVWKAAFTRLRELPKLQVDEPADTAKARSDTAAQIRKLLSETVDHE